MRPRAALTTTAAIVAVAATMIAPSGAGAATLVGNDCTATTGMGNLAAVQLATAPGSPYPIGSPTAGVLTKWKLTLLPTETKVPTRLMVLRPTADPKQFVDVAESPTVTVVQGVNDFDVRIPVQAGDRFGSAGMAPGGALFCVTESTADVVGVGLVPTIGTNLGVVIEPTNRLVSVLATIEPDADNDGYGDETQDLCPQGAAIQTACPVTVLDAFPIARRSAITVIVSSSSETPVAVSGVAGKAKLKKVTKTVQPGTIAKFKLKLTPRIKSTLAELGAGKKLTVRITAQASNLTGKPSKDSAKLKLRGTG